MLGGGCWDFWIVPALAHGEEPDSSSTFQPLLRLFVFFPELLHLNLWWNLVSFSFSFRFSPGRLLPKVSTFALFSPLFQFSDGKVGKRCFFQKKKKRFLSNCIWFYRLLLRASPFLHCQLLFIRVMIGTSQNSWSNCLVIEIVFFFFLLATRCSSSVEERSIVRCVVLIDLSTL